MTRPPRIVWAGLAVVLAAAAVLSFDALRALALAVAIPPHLAWLLPLAVDAGAAVSCATWLGGRTDRHTARIAGGMTWALLAVTVLGNAGQLGMHAHGIAPPWWVAVLVGAIPPAIVGAVVHLVVLLVRRGPAAAEHVPAAVPSEPMPTVLAGHRHDEPSPVPALRAPTEQVPVPGGEPSVPEPAVPEPEPGHAPRRGTDEEIVQHLREHGLPSRRQLNKAFTCGTDRYDRLLAEAREPALRRVQ
jgi:hypothetical protein